MDEEGGGDGDDERRRRGRRMGTGDERRQQRRRNRHGVGGHRPRVAPGDSGLDDLARTRAVAAAADTSTSSNAHHPRPLPQDRPVNAAPAAAASASASAPAAPSSSSSSPGRMTRLQARLRLLRELEQSEREREPPERRLRPGASPPSKRRRLDRDGGDGDRHRGDDGRPPRAVAGDKGPHPPPVAEAEAIAAAEAEAEAEAETQAEAGAVPSRMARMDVPPRGLTFRMVLRSGPVSAPESSAIANGDGGDGPAGAVVVRGSSDGPAAGADIVEGDVEDDRKPAAVAIAAPPVDAAASTASMPPAASSTAATGLSRGPIMSGEEWVTALYASVRNGTVDEAMDLLSGRVGRGVAAGGTIDVNGLFQKMSPNPLAVACQKGYLPVVEALLSDTFRADPSLHSTQSGSTPLIQACHFGRVDVVRRLVADGRLGDVDKANYKSTTALMRASQEGHEEIVRILLRHRADVNRKNHEQMTPLMLASQRGHASIVRLLVEAGADIDGKTAQDSTPLMLACKRGHVEVAKVLVAAGTELELRDSKGRRAVDTALRKDMVHLATFLVPRMQVYLMRMEARKRRSRRLCCVWYLLQAERALVPVVTDEGGVGDDYGDASNSSSPSCHALGGGAVVAGFGRRQEVTIHAVAAGGLRGDRDGPLGVGPEVDSAATSGGGRRRYRIPNSSRRALVQTMMLPEPLMNLVAEYIPLPHLFDTRLEALRNRCHIDADATVKGALDLIDEVLAEGQFSSACDLAKVPPPMSEFSSWANWERWGRDCDRLRDRNDRKRERERDGEAETDSLYAGANEQTHCWPESSVDGVELCASVSSYDLRSQVCFLALLSRENSALTKTLSSPPFKMPKSLVHRLRQYSHLQSVVRRIRGVHFEVSVAVEMVTVAAEVVSWFLLRCREED